MFLDIGPSQIKWFKIVTYSLLNPAYSEPFQTSKMELLREIVKTSIAHNRYLIFLFLEDNDLISAKSSAQLLPLKEKFTCFLLSFLITAFCKSLAICSFKLIYDPVFLTKN